MLSLVFALRIARLQDAKRRLKKAKRQQVALETLQFLAPLSYQVPPPLLLRCTNRAVMAL